MRDLAAELGTSIVVPVVCRYCGEDIFLFAAPNGGFAIFDSLGPPWPKHQCVGISQSARGYAVRDATFSKTYRMPVMGTPSVVVPTVGRTVAGTVVAEPDATGIQIVYDGRTLWRVKILPALPLGTYVRGVVFADREIAVLRDVEVLQSVDGPSDSELTWIKHLAKTQRPKATVPETDRQIGTKVRVLEAAGELAPPETAELQLGSLAVRERAPNSAILLECASDASLNGNRLVAFCILADIAAIRSEVVQSSEKARCVQLAKAIVDGLQLHPLITNLRTKLVKGTVDALNQELRSWLEMQSAVGRLRKKVEIPIRLLQNLTKLWGEEKRFADYLDKQYKPSRSIAEIVREWALIPAGIK